MPHPVQFSSILRVFADLTLTVLRSSKEFLVASPFGRMALHTLCLLRGGRFRWHCAGILREFRNALLR
jgi:hypothetical protein